MLMPERIWNKIRARPTVVPKFAEISAERVQTPLTGVNPILPEHHYFAILVDELFLAHSRKWTKEFDPMVLAITEFSHGGKMVSLPFVIGPKLLGDKADMVPQGMLYRRTRVAGVHPFRGGRVISTIVLFQVRRVDYARQLLKLVESVSTAIPFGGDVGTYTKLSGVLLDGIDALMGVGETTPLVGIRQEFDHDLGTPIRPAYFALIDGPENTFPQDRLWVRDGSLMIGDSGEQLQPFHEASYVLFSTRGAKELSELNTLPQHATVATIIDLAASPEEADWKRAKAELVVLLRQLLNSPDITHEQALMYHENIVQQAQEAHKRALSIGTLSASPKSVLEDELRRSVNLLDLP